MHARTHAHTHTLTLTLTHTHSHTHTHTHTHTCTHHTTFCKYSILTFSPIPCLQDPDSLTSIEDELEGTMAQISWANDNIEKLQEDIVTFEDMKVNKLCPTCTMLLLIHSILQVP